jgi:hypothetical protein
MGVHDVGGPGLSQQTSNLMGIFREEADNVAATQEPPQLSLAWWPAHLSNYRRGSDRNDARFKASTVIGPDFSVIPVRGD